MRLTFWVFLVGSRMPSNSSIFSAPPCSAAVSTIRLLTRWFSPLAVPAATPGSSSFVPWFGIVCSDALLYERLKCQLFLPGGAPCRWSS